MFCLICGNIPVAKHRDLTIRKNIAKSAATYALSTVQIAALESLEDHVVDAYLLGMTKNALQKLRYYIDFLLLFLLFKIILIILIISTGIPCWEQSTISSTMKFS